MKKFVIIILIILIIILITSCSKEYKITVRSTIKKTDIFGKSLLEETRTDIYYAVKIIKFSDRSVIFIDKQGREKFVSGDYIEITEWK